jgi:hypothetical protein
MPVHNGMPWLQLAVESILNQTLPDYEFLIMDDASTDETPIYLNSIHDQRLRVIRTDIKRGITPALIQAVNEARAPFIARMDADDIAEPQRLALQYERLHACQDVGLLGSDWKVINACGEEVLEERAIPMTDAEIRLFGAWNSPLAHPTVMMRAAILREHRLNYLKHLTAAQDYALWFDLLQHTQGANLPSALLRYRKHNSNVSSIRREEQRKVRREMSLRFLTQLLTDTDCPKEQVLSLHKAMLGDAPGMGENRNRALPNLFKQLRRWSDRCAQGQVSLQFRHYLSRLVLKANQNHASRVAMLLALKHFSLLSIPRLLPLLLRTPCANLPS